MLLPDAVVRAYLLATRANATYVDAEAARARIRALAAHPAPSDPPRRLRRDVEVRLEQRDGWQVAVVVPTAVEPRGAVVYVHGGGWIGEIVVQHWRLVAQLAAEAATTVVVPIYPLAPHGTAEVVVDGVVGLALACREAFDDLRLAGDSAGGQIALSAAMVLRDRHDVLPSRTALVAPGLDLSWSNPDIPRVQPRDPWLGVPGGCVRTEAWRGSLPVSDPRVSPLAGDLAGLGPISLWTGTDDILHPDALLLASAAHAAGVDVEVHVGEGQLHAYPLLPTAQGRDARRLLVARLTADAR